MEISAPAKINLYLQIIGKRKDGYHDIATLFERVSIYDRISVEPSAKNTTITCSDDGVPTGENSLLGNIIEAFRRRSGNKVEVSVNVGKNIPVSAGLGGGSSDAAALLKGLNEISGSPLNLDELAEIGGNYGADIPFFIYDAKFAFAEEKGDRIKKVKSDMRIWHVLITPPFGVSTKEIYDKVPPLGLTKNKGIDRMFTTFLSKNDLKSVIENLRNDLQKITLGDFPVLELVFSEIRKTGAEGVLLSGSGPTVFGIYRDERSAREAEKFLNGVFAPDEGWKTFIAHTV